jgi:hypothetical protein
MIQEPDQRRVYLAGGGSTKNAGGLDSPGSLWEVQRRFRNKIVA